MKNYLYILILLFFSCQTTEQPQEPSQTWLNQSIDLSSIQPVVNTYHMFDTAKTKVGSMIFGTYLEEGKIVSRDTSSFDDGSVYEEATFIFNTDSYRLEDVSVAMQINTTRLDVNVEAQESKVNGTYSVTRDTVINDYPVDSLYTYDVFRSELYMLMQALDFKAGDTIRFKALVSTSMTVSDASLYYVGEEKITTAAGTFDCTVIHLMTDGKMPQNRIWISKEESKKMIKFYVPGSELSIELMSSRKSQ